ncbi:MAG: VOC family protein [Flavobacteriaceae bacterium]|nr:VOC family protein [Flavobacteriaceae bacterium]
MNSNTNFDPGNFSVSLAVKDLQKSKEFYENLGFTTFGGNQEHGWLILKSDYAVIGLFQGMIQENILTFNPGWDNTAKNLEEFTDVREIQKSLIEKGIQLEKTADENTSGPEHIILKDPDGNVIMFDQHR